MNKPKIYYTKNPAMRTLKELANNYRSFDEVSREHMRELQERGYVRIDPRGFPYVTRSGKFVCFVE